MQIENNTSMQLSPQIRVELREISGAKSQTSTQHFRQKGLLLCLPFIPHLPAAEEDRKSLNLTLSTIGWSKHQAKKSGYCPLLRSFCFLQWGFPRKNRPQFLAWLFYSQPFVLFSFLRMTYYSGKYDNYSTAQSFWVIPCVVVSLWVYIYIHTHVHNKWKINMARFLCTLTYLGLFLSEYSPEV